MCYRMSLKLVVMWTFDPLIVEASKDFNSIPVLQRPLKMPCFVLMVNKYYFDLYKTVPHICVSTKPIFQLELIELENHLWVSLIKPVNIPYWVNISFNLFIIIILFWLYTVYA